MSKDDVFTAIGFIVLALSAYGMFYVQENWRFLAVKTGLWSIDKTTCKDVTSYDYNWNNDMKCMRPDGSVFYTNYSGARESQD
jgi:hypothetical protein